VTSPASANLNENQAFAVPRHNIQLTNFTPPVGTNHPVALLGELPGGQPFTQVPQILTRPTIHFYFLAPAYLYKTDYPAICYTRRVLISIGRAFQARAFNFWWAFFFHESPRKIGETLA